MGVSSDQLTKQMRSRASAYALYVLAKAHSGDIARLRWYHDVQFKDEQSPLARAQIAAGLAMMGDRARARLGFREAIDKLGYSDPNDWYQSPLRDLAGVIALAYESGNADIAQSLIGRLEAAVKTPEQMNTIEDAYVLRAASYMLKASGPTHINAQGVSTLPGGLNVERFGVTQLAAAHMTNTGSGAIWRTVTVIGTPSAPPGAVAQGLSVSKTYYNLDGTRLDPSHLIQGQKVLIVLTGHSSDAATRPVVVDDALPAGFEIDSTLSNDDAKDGPFKFVGTISDTKVAEARDDRFIAALDLSSAHDFTPGLHRSRRDPGRLLPARRRGEGLLPRPKLRPHPRRPHGDLGPAVEMTVTGLNIRPPRLRGGGTAARRAWWEGGTDGWEGTDASESVFDLGSPFRQPVCYAAVCHLASPARARKRGRRRLDAHFSIPNRPPYPPPRQNLDRPAGGRGSPGRRQCRLSTRHDQGLARLTRRGRPQWRLAACTAGR